MTTAVYTHTHTNRKTFVRSRVLKRRTVHGTNFKTKKYICYIFEKRFTYLIAHYTEVCLCAKNVLPVCILVCNVIVKKGVKQTCNHPYLYLRQN